MLAFVYVPSRSLFAVLVLPILAVFLAVATLPAAAGAAVFCAPAPCSEGTPAATIQDALDAADANAGPDVVAVTAGTHNVGTGLQNLDEETELRGAGVGETIITGDDFPLADPGTGRTLVAGKYSSLHDMTLRLPSAVTSGPSSWTGADIYDAVVEDLAIDAVGATFGPGLNDGAGNAMLIRSGTIRNLDIDIPLDADASGLQAGAIGGTFDLADVTISAPFAFTSVPQADPDPVTVRAKRFRITSNRGVQVVDGFLELSDSVIDVSAAPSSPDPEDFPVGIEVFDGRAPSPAGLTMDRVTLIGNGDANATAMSVAGQGGIPATNLRARHVAASGFGRTLGFANFSSNPSATISFSNVPTRTGSIFNFGEDPATLGGRPDHRQPRRRTDAAARPRPAVRLARRRHRRRGPAAGRRHRPRRQPASGRRRRQRHRPQRRRGLRARLLTRRRHADDQVQEGEAEQEGQGRDRPHLPACDQAAFTLHDDGDVEDAQQGQVQGQEEAADDCKVEAGDDPGRQDEGRQDQGQGTRSSNCCSRTGSRARSWPRPGSRTATASGAQSPGS